MCPVVWLLLFMLFSAHFNFFKLISLFETASLYIALAGLELRDVPVSTSRVLELKVGTATPSWYVHLKDEETEAQTRSCYPAM